MSVVTQTRVLTGPFLTGGRFSHVHKQPGGDRFVLVRPATDNAITNMTVVVNWFEELKARVGN